MINNGNMYLYSVTVFMVHTRLRTVHIASHFKVLRAD